MKKQHISIVLLLFMAVLQVNSYAQTDPLALPLGKGLPLVVRTGVSFRSVDVVDENASTFTATIDLRMRWQDLRLKFTPADATVDFIQYTDVDGTTFPEIWMPIVAIDNMEGEPISQTRSLRIFPNGQVELMQRIKATFAAEYDVFRFPFDIQQLTVTIVSKKEDKLRLNFDYQQDDLEFSNIAEGLEVAGWNAKTIELARKQTPGWYGKNFPNLNASLIVARDPTGSMFGIFLPLLASLLIPLLIIWLNKVEDGEFKVDGFELTNIVIGGLFAVVALNFTVNSSYLPLAGGDNTVMRLFGLNYITLATSFAICILLYRYNVVTRIKGRYFEEELFAFINWAIPLSVFMFSLFIMLYAAL